MGMQIFETSGSFDPTIWGLSVGDVVQTVVVGGGASGLHKTNSSGQNLSNPGSASSFGSYVSAAGGSSDHTAPNGMGAGGSGIGGNTNSKGCGAGGAGGYIPGIPVYGGNGGNATSGAYFSAILPSGLGGIGGVNTDSETINGSVLATPYGNFRFGGIGNKGATGGEGSNFDPAGGNGYGAGGAGYGIGINRYGHGGNSGAIAFGTVVLTSTSPIAVTVGSGGTMNGSYGADGVVIVTW